MDNFNRPGELLTFTAPSGGVTSGSPYLIGSLLVIAAQSAAQGASFEGAAVGVYKGTKVATEAWTELQKVYWDDTAKKFTEDAGSSPANVLVGVAAAAVEADIGLATSESGSPAPLVIADNVLTVADYSLLGDETITVTVARDDGKDPLVYVLTESVEWVAEDSEAQTAQNIADAIDALPGVSAEYVQVAGSPPTETVVVTSDNPVPGHVRLDGAVR